MESNEHVIYDNFIDCDYQDVNDYTGATPKTKDPLSSSDNCFVKFDSGEKDVGVKIKQDVNDYTGATLKTKDPLSSSDDCFVKFDPGEKDVEVKIKQEIIPLPDDEMPTEPCTELTDGVTVKIENDQEIKDVKLFIPLSFQTKEECIKKEHFSAENIVKKETLITNLLPYVKIFRLPKLEEAVLSSMNNEPEIKIQASSYSQQSLQSNSTDLWTLSCNKHCDMKGPAHCGPVIIETEALSGTATTLFDEKQSVKKGFECEDSEFLSTDSSNLISNEDNLLNSHQGNKNGDVIQFLNSFKPVISLIRCDQVHSSVKTFTCDICAKSFELKMELEEHIKSHSGVERFPCSICSASFKQKPYLKMHLKRHTGIKPFRCKTCKKTFLTKAELILHKKIHSKRTPISCDTCGRRCIDKQYLVNHMVRHSGIKSFNCKLCAKTFVTKRELKLHEIKHTSDKPFSCKKCGKTFKRKVCLVLHEQFNSCYFYKHAVNLTK